MEKKAAPKQWLFRVKHRVVTLHILFYVDKKNYATFSGFFCLHNNVDNYVDIVQNPLQKADFMGLPFCYKLVKCLTFSILISIFVRLWGGTCQNGENAVK